MITSKYLDNTYWFKGQVFSDQTVELTSFPLSVLCLTDKKSVFFVGMCFSFPQDLVRHMVEQDLKFVGIEAKTQLRHMFLHMFFVPILMFMLQTLQKYPTDGYGG